MIAGSLTIIDSSTGLLNTPLLEETVVYLDILFEPRLVFGQGVKLKATTGPSDFINTYKVVSIHHRGTISDAVCGDAVTTVGLLGGIFAQVEP